MPHSQNTLFHSGLSGLQLPVPKYLFPPPFEHASRLTYYASLFNSIEINSSFYKIPQPATVSKWATSVPEHFKFTFKLWKEITHSKGLNFREEDVELFFNAVNHIANKAGCLLIQFPPGLDGQYIVELKRLLICIATYNTAYFRIAVEFRNRSWYTHATYKLLNYFKAALVLHNIPKSATPLISHESYFIYTRFHGPTGNYRDSYSQDFLSEYAAYLQEWMAEGKEVYIYFNNTMGDAFNNLKTINGFLEP